MTTNDSTCDVLARIRPALLAGLFVVLYLAPLAVRPLSAPDEFRYAEIGREMLASGDWVVPRLDGLLYFEKPVLGYWQIAASLAVFGLNAFAARLPSALAAGLTAVLLVVLVRRATGHRGLATLAGAAWLTALMPFAVGSTAILDASFTAWVTAGIVCTHLALEEPRPRRAAAWWLGAGLGGGLAVLVKGPLGLAVPGVVLLSYLVLGRRLALFLRWLWLPALSATAVVAPWAIAIGRRTDFWHHFILVEHVQRFTAPGETQHAEPVWFFVTPLLAAVLPWLVLLPVTIVGLRTRVVTSSRRALRVLALSWLVMPFLLFSASAGKLETYILPCVPPALVLLLDGALIAVADRGVRVLKGPSLLNAVLGTLFTAAVVGLVLTNPRAAAAAAHQSTGWWALGLAAAAWAVCGLLGAASRSPERVLTLLALSPVGLLIASSFAVDDHLVRNPGPAITGELAATTSEWVLVGDRDTAQAVAWITRRADVEVFGDAGELGFGLERDPDRRLRVAADVVGWRAAGRPVALLLEGGRWRSHQSALPAPDRMVTTPRFVLALYDRETPAASE